MYRLLAITFERGNKNKQINWKYSVVYWCFYLSMFLFFRRIFFFFFPLKKINPYLFNFVNLEDFCYVTDSTKNKQTKSKHKNQSQNSFSFSFKEKPFSTQGKKKG